jgi:hypothetical protein
MKQIQPVSIWYNGQIVIATIFNLASINDNLIDSATFYWKLFDATKIQVSQGNLTMSGTDYTNYSSNPDSNEYAYQWGATQLNLTLV